MATFIASTADISCTFGDKKSKLTVLPTRTIFLNGKPMANISDHKPLVNIAPFGKCRSLANPVVAAATAAHHGHLTPMPCIPNTPQPWMLGKTDVIEKGDAALKKDCKLRCMWAGIISINTDGQTGEGVQPIRKQVKNILSRISGGEKSIVLNTSMGSNQMNQDPLGINTTELDTSLSGSIINNYILDTDKALITAKEADFLLPSFSGYSADEQDYILKIANNVSLISNRADLNASYSRSARLAAAEKHMLYYYKPVLPINNLTKQQSTSISNNNEELEKVLDVKKGDPMTTVKADKQNANPKYGSDDKYGTNCVTTTAAYLLRLRGFDVTAKPRGQVHTDYLSTHPYDIWKNSDGTAVKPIGTLSWMQEKKYDKMTTERYLEFFNETCSEPGVYQVVIGWPQSEEDKVKNNYPGHSTILQRLPNGELRYIEPQVDFFSEPDRDIKWLASRGTETPQAVRGILRVDDKIFNTEYADIFETK